MPKLSFGMALPVGVSSREEWINVFLREDFCPGGCGRAAAPGHAHGACPPAGRAVVPWAKASPQPVEERYELRVLGDVAGRMGAVGKRFLEKEQWLITRRTKRGTRELDIRPLIREASMEGDTVTMTCDWRAGLPEPAGPWPRPSMDGASLLDFTLTKTAQRFA